MQQDTADGSWRVVGEGRAPATLTRAGDPVVLLSDEMTIQTIGGKPSPDDGVFVGQQGVFMVFGRNAAPMERVVVTEGFPKECLTKVTVGRSHVADMRRSMLNHGITESVVFPDLEGLAREIKRVFGFEV